MCTVILGPVKSYWWEIPQTWAGILFHSSLQLPCSAPCLAFSTCSVHIRWVNRWSIVWWKLQEAFFIYCLLLFSKIMGYSHSRFISGTQIQTCAGWTKDSVAKLLRKIWPRGRHLDPKYKSETVLKALLISY